MLNPLTITPDEIREILVKGLLQKYKDCKVEYYNCLEKAHLNERFMLWDDKKKKFTKLTGVIDRVHVEVYGSENIHCFENFIISEINLITKDNHIIEVLT